MLEITLFLGILYGRLKVLELKAKEIISLCTTVQEANEVREKYDRNCRISTITISALFFVYLFVIIFVFDGDIIIMFRFIPMFVFGYGIMKGFVHHPISTLSITDLKYEYYALFLRGFDADNYNPENKLNRIKIENKKRKKERVVFTEAEMQKSLKKHCCNHTIAIGMPQEVFSPIGCERIYCEPETWKQDVGHLINDSLFNIVLLNDRPSCLYELDHCFTVASKTYCIICDRNIYENLREIYDMFPSVSIQEPFFFRLDNAAITYPYNPKDFAQIIKEDLEKLRDEKVYQNFKRLKEDKNAEKNKKRIKIGCLLILLSVLYFYLKYI